MVGRHAVMLSAETVCPFAFGLLKLGDCEKNKKKSDVKWK